MDNATLNLLTEIKAVLRDIKGELSTRTLLEVAERNGGDLQKAVEIVKAARTAANSGKAPVAVVEESDLEKSMANL